jgi:hypothetical protein
MILEAPIHLIRRKSPRILVIANPKSQRSNKNVDIVVMKHQCALFKESFNDNNIIVSMVMIFPVLDQWRCSTV